MPSEPSGKGGRRAVQIGKYQVLAHIATGGMGAVYKALDTDLNREVALKVLPHDLAAKPAILERFRREARSAGKLRHENIVAIYEFSEANGTYFLALEFVDGMDLHELICRRGKLKPSLARQILIQAGRALAHAHEQGIVHRDIKPSNILIAQQGNKPLAKLADLGLALEAGDDDNRLTRIGCTVGTVDYMSPEQARDSRAADIRSDIYSLGCTFYHMLTGTCPFPAGSLTERIYQHVEAEPADVRTFNPDVPAELVAILRRMLAKKPADRYQTPLELLHDLENPDALGVGLPALAALDETLPDAPPVPRPPSTSSRLRPPTPPTVPARAEERPPTLAPPILPAKKRYRDLDDEPAEEPESAGPREPRRRARKRATLREAAPWWPWAAGAALLMIVLLLLRALSGGGSDAPPPPQKGQGPGEPKDRVNPAQAEGQRAPAPNGAAARQRDGPDLGRLRGQFEGPLTDFPAPPADAIVLRVSRLATPGRASFRSLKDACAAAPAGRHAIIEIQDNGPLFEPAVRAVGCSLTIRAAPGFRPLLAWEGAGAGADRFLSVTKGSLTLESLDVVLKWQDGRAERPAALFAVSGTFAARGCTFSVAGKHPHGVRVALLEPQGGPGKCRLTHCFLRGAGLTAVAVRDAGADVLLDGCLVVSVGELPLLDVCVAEDAACTLRLVRSTLVAGTNLLHVAPASPGGKDARPAVRCLCWDAVLARAGVEAGGELVRVTGGAAVGRMSWQSANTVCAGWEKLLAAAGKDIPAAADAWRAAWGEGAGDRVLPQPWPASVPPGLEDVGPNAFDLKNLSNFPAATASAAPVGCDPAALPPGRIGWPGLTYDRFAAAPLDLPGDDGPPPIPATNDARYHGERVRLDGRVDLGKLLRAKLQGLPPGPRVVLHISGSGLHETSPIQLRGADLVLYFERVPGAAPLTLTPNPRFTGAWAALVEVEGGGLEMTGARIVFADARQPMPPRVVRVRGGSLRLCGCYLQGPLTAAPPEYQGLIEFGGSGKEEPEQAAGCALNECVLLSARALLTVSGTGARVSLHQCALLALGDALCFDPGENAPARRNVTCTLSRNTVAARRAALHVKDALEVPAGVEPVVIQADGNLFLNPFGEIPRRACLLVYEGEALTRGLVLWQGKGNGYDRKRLHAYAVAEGDPTPAMQTHATWARLWGKAGEQQAHLLDWPETAGWPIRPNRPPLESLQLPPQVNIPVGADLARLGIVGKR